MEPAEVGLSMTVGENTPRKFDSHQKVRGQGLHSGRQLRGLDDSSGWDDP